MPQPTLNQLLDKTEKEFEEKWWKKEKEDGFCDDYPDCACSNSRNSEKVKQFIRQSQLKSAEQARKELMEEAKQIMLRNSVQHYIGSDGYLVANTDKVIQELDNLSKLK